MSTSPDFHRPFAIATGQTGDLGRRRPAVSVTSYGHSLLQLIAIATVPIRGYKVSVTSYGHSLLQRRPLGFPPNIEGVSVTSYGHSLLQLCLAGVPVFDERVSVTSYGHSLLQPPFIEGRVR